MQTITVMVSRPGWEAQTSLTRILGKVQRWGMMTSAYQVPRHDENGEGGVLPRCIFWTPIPPNAPVCGSIAASPLVYPHRLPIAPWQPFRAIHMCSKHLDANL